MSCNDLQMDRYQDLPFSIVPLKKMMSYNIYPTIPSALEDPQVAYHLCMIQNK